MPAADVVLLPLCVGLTLLGVVVTGVAWRRGNKGRVLQGAGLALAPIALYLTGLLTLLWNGIVALGGWASNIIFSPAVWFGLGLLALCLVLWVVGGMLARRTLARSGGNAVEKSAGSKPVSAPGSKAVSAQAGKSRTVAKKGQPAPEPVDEDMAEIEAILKSRGIQ